MASISSLIVAQNQLAASSTGKARHGGKQNQHGGISFGDLLSKTLVTAEDQPEKAGTKTAGKSAKGDAHRAKASAQKVQHETDTAAAATAVAAAVIVPQEASATNGKLAATDGKVAATDGKLATTETSDAGLEAISGAADQEKPQARNTVTAVKTGIATDTDAIDTESAAQSAPVDDILRAVRAAVSRTEHARSALQAGDSTTDKGNPTRTAAQTAPSSDAPAAPHAKHAAAPTAGQPGSDQPSDGSGSARRSLEGAGAVQAPGEATAGKTAVAAATDDAKLATSALGAVSHQPIQVAASTDVPEVTKQVLAPRVASEEWGPALGKQMVWMANANQQQAELHLNPPDLGPLTVKLVMSENQAQATFASPHQSVLAAVEAALPQLRTSLAESGISLGNTSLGPNGQNQGMLAQDQSGQSGQSGQRSYREDNSGFSNLMAGTETSASATPADPVTIRGNGGAIDTFV